MSVYECVHWHTNAPRRWDETRTQTRNSFYYYYLLIHAHTITHPKCSTVWMPTLRTDLSCNQCVGPLNFCALSIRQPPLQITQNEIQKNHDRLLNVWKTFLFHFNYFFFFPLASIEMFVYLFSRMPNFLFLFTHVGGTQYESPNWTRTISCANKRNGINEWCDCETIITEHKIISYSIFCPNLNHWWSSFCVNEWRGNNWKRSLFRSNKFLKCFSSFFSIVNKHYRKQCRALQFGWWKCFALLGPTILATLHGRTILLQFPFSFRFSVLIFFLVYIKLNIRFFFPFLYYYFFLKCGKYCWEVSVWW